MRVDRWLAACALLALLVPAARAAQAEPAAETRAGTERPEDDAQPLDGTQLDLTGRLRDVRIERAGEQVLVRTEIDGEERLLTPEDWVGALEETQRARDGSNFLYRFLNITSPWAMAWVAVGFLGQALFTGRMLLQWLASEKQRRSIVPTGFWWCSLAGGVLLLSYFVWRKDVVGVIGQSTGVVVYARNLMLIRRQSLVRRASAAAATAS